jgi:putative transcriptional regulator
MKRDTDRRQTLAEAIVEMADGLAQIGAMDPAEHRMITLRHGKSTLAHPALSADDVRHIRETSNLSQAVFARHLNVTTGYISQLERGKRTPKGATLALLHLIRRKGIAAVL